jgi:type I restriction enzyme R subunit
MNLSQSLDAEQRRAVELGLSEDQLTLFDLLNKKSLNANEREALKQESRALLADLQHLIAPLDRWTEKEQTQAEVETFILDHLYMALPDPLYSAEEKSTVANLIYRHVWQQSASGQFPAQ